MSIFSKRLTVEPNEIVAEVAAEPVVEAALESSTPVAEEVPAEGADIALEHNDGGTQVIEQTAATEGEGSVETEALAAEAAAEEPKVESTEDVAQESLVETQDAPETSEEETLTLTNAEGSVRKKVSAAKMFSAMESMTLADKLNRSVRNLQVSLNDVRMISNFQIVAKDHSLSAPVVAAFRATPGFITAVKNFPDTSLYNVVPEHRSSANSVVGLESLVEANSGYTAMIPANVEKVVANLSEILASAVNTVGNLKAQLQDDKEDLEASDVTEEVLGTLSVTALTDTGFLEGLTKLDDYLKMVDVFNVDELKAHPEKIEEEVEGLSSLVSDIGKIIGLTLTPSGLVEADKDDQFIPTAATFAEKGLTKTGLIFYIDKANGILDSIEAVLDKRGDILASLNEATNEIPEALDSDDVTYGANDHLTLLMCYATLTTKLITESIFMTSMLLSTVDSVLNIEIALED